MSNMNKTKKKCRFCDTIVASYVNECPKCNGNDFESVDEKNASQMTAGAEETSITASTTSKSSKKKGFKNWSKKKKIVFFIIIGVVLLSIILLLANPTSNNDGTNSGAETMPTTTKYYIGDTVESGDFSCTVNRYSFLNGFLYLDCTITNISNSESNINVDYFTLHKDTIKYNLHSENTAIRSSTPFSPGVSRTVIIAFEVPNNTDTYTLEFDTSIMATDCRIIIAYKE